MIFSILVLQIVFHETVYGSVTWKLSTIPVVFGKTVKLTCEPCTGNSKKWFGGPDNTILCSNGECYQEQKYYMTIHTRDQSFELNIRHFEITDIGIEYTCACHFQTYKQILLVPEYIYKPTRDMITFSHAEGENSVVQVNVTIEKIYPVPDCPSLSFSQIIPTGGMEAGEYALEGGGINPDSPRSTHHTSRKIYKITNSNMTFYKAVFSNYTISLEIGYCLCYLSMTCSLGNEAFTVVDVTFSFYFNSRGKKLEQPKVNWYDKVCTASIPIAFASLSLLGLIFCMIGYDLFCSTYWQKRRWKRCCAAACKTLIKGLNVIICFCNIIRKRVEISYKRHVEEENPHMHESLDTLVKSQETADSAEDPV